MLHEFFIALVRAAALPQTCCVFNALKLAKLPGLKGALKEDLFTPHSNIIDCQVLNS